MECLHPSFSTVETLTKLQLVQDKIANLPSEYFDDPQAPAADGGVGARPQGGNSNAMAIADAGEPDGVIVHVYAGIRTYWLRSAEEEDCWRSE